ncbi:MAG: ureidoglycolate lyase [Xanthomonadales bacterium]|nr:ureidoglycolate lyase [Xanthomonadales bacterium]
MIFRPQPLETSRFQAYGDLVDLNPNGKGLSINSGTATSWGDLADIQVLQQDGKPKVSIYRAQPVSLPAELSELECHPLGSQMFVPLGRHPYLVVVAESGELNLDTLRVFQARPDQAVNFHPGVWHHYLLALQGVSDFLVLDRGGPETNLQQVRLPQPLTVEPMENKP